MDIGFSADGWSIPETLRDFFNRLGDISFRLGHAFATADFRKTDRCANSTGPGPKIFRREMATGGFLEITIHVGRSDGMTLSRFIQELEKVFPGQLLASMNDLR